MDQFCFRSFGTPGKPIFVTEVSRFPYINLETAELAIWVLVLSR